MLFFKKKKKKKEISEELRIRVREYFDINYEGRDHLLEGSVLSSDTEAEGHIIDALPYPHFRSGNGSGSGEAFDAAASYSMSEAQRVDDGSYMECIQVSGEIPEPEPEQTSAIRPCFARHEKKHGRRLADLDLQLDESFARRLFRMIDERGMTDSEVYNRAGLDRRVFSKIRKNLDDYRPTRETALALAIGLMLNLDETLDLLSAAGIRLSRSIATDVIVMYFIENKEYDMISINLMLDEYGLKPLTGSRDGARAG